jgi:hypothetical protein
VFALKSGVPAIAIDSVAGGDKVSAQARTLGWPACATFENATDAWLDEQWNWCRSPEARAEAARCAAAAGWVGEEVGSALGQALNTAFTPTAPPPDRPGPRRGIAGRLLGRFGSG